MFVLGQRAVLKYFFMNKAFAGIKEYFTGALSEMKKVVWPTQKQTVRYSIAVILMSLFVALFFGVLDYVFNELLAILISV